MDSSSTFRPISISDEKDLSVPFLVDWILAVILCILAPFYLGRILAWVLTKGLDFWVWRQYKIKINLQSIKVSFLGGRIFFKNLTVVSNDFTISFLEGSFTWRYWLLHTRIRGIDFESEDGDASENAKLPCRFLLQCDGLEVFVYNKIDVYESVLRDHFTNVTKDGQETESNDDITINTEKAAANSKLSNSSRYSYSGRSKSTDAPKLSAKTKLFPIQLEANRAAIVLGNRNTRHVGVFKFEQAKGVYDIFSSISDLDYYRTKISLDLYDALFELRTNLGYQNDNPIKTFVVEKTMDKIWQTVKKQCISISKLLLPNQGKTINNQQAYIDSWKGLDLYHHTKAVQEENVDTTVLHEQEYARYSRVMKAERVSLTYYFDIPGIVPANSSSINSQSDRDESLNCNQDDDTPAFGTDIHIYTAAVYYGPWAHKHMQDIIRLFSPIVSRDQMKATKPEPGSLRIYENFKLSVDFRDKSVLHIPTRESSKDEEFIKRYKTTGDTHRAFGWLNVSLNEGGEILFNLALCSQADRLPNELYVLLLNPEIKSSVNHEVLFRCNTQTIKANIGYPTGWNKQADWLFELDSRTAELFLLRDHISLISDLFTDFSANDALRYELFRPFTYEIKWVFTEYKLFLNVNDANIINNLLDLNENCFLSLSGDILNTSINLPFTSIVKEPHETTFLLKSPLVKLSIHPPCWNTLHEFLSETTFGECPDFSMTGTYISFPSVDVDNTDTILIDFRSSSTKFLSFGFVLRYLMNIKLNYFGDFNHFKTTEEYSNDLSMEEDTKTKTKNFQEQPTNDVESLTSSSSDGSYQVADTINENTIHKSSLLRTKNETDVWITFFVNDGCIIIPENLYDCQRSFLLSFRRLEFDMRYTNYFMDLTAFFSRIYLNHSNEFSFNRIVAIEESHSENTGYLDDLNLHGHRMFGVPPVEETYLCKWDISIGSLSTDSDGQFLFSFLEAIQKVGFTYKDAENILIYSIHKPEDVTSLTISIGRVSSIVRTNHGGSATLSLNDITINSWDLSNSRYSKRVDLLVAAISVCAIDEKKTVLFTCDTAVELTKFVVRSNMKNHRVTQQNCVLLNDSPFHRCKFLLAFDQLNHSTLYDDLLGSITPSISLPTLSEPLTFQTFDNIYERLLGSYINLINFDTDIIDTKNLTDDRPDDKRLLPLSNTVSNDLSGQLAEEFESENTTVNISTLSVFVTPKAFTFAENAAHFMLTMSTESIMDYFEMNIVNIFSVGHITNGKFFNSSVMLKNVKVNISDETALDKTQLEALDRLELSVSNISVISKILKYPQNLEQSNESTGITDDSTISCNFDSLQFNIFKSSKNRLTKVLPIAWFEILMFNTVLFSDVGKVSKLIFGSIKSAILDADVEWTVEYLLKLAKAFCKEGKSCIELGKLRSIDMKETIIRVAELGKISGIDSVPYIITKPAYITRLSKFHVRDTASWKIITRLRHVSKHTSHVSETTSQCDDIPEEVRNICKDKSQFLDIFVDWKNWDVYEVEQSSLFTLLFSGESTVHEEDLFNELSLSLEMLHLELPYASQQSSIIAKQIDLCVKKMSHDAILDFDTMGYDKKEIDFDLLISYADIRASMQLIERIILLKQKLFPQITDIENKTNRWVSKIYQTSFRISQLTLHMLIEKYMMLLDLQDLSIAGLETSSEINSLLSAKFSSETLSFNLLYLDRIISRILLEKVTANFFGTENENIRFFTSNIGSVVLDSSDLTLTEMMKHARALLASIDDMKAITPDHDSEKKNGHVDLVWVLSLKVGSLQLQTSAFVPFIIRILISGLDFNFKNLSGISIIVNYTELLLDFYFNQLKLLRISNSVTKVDYRSNTLLTDIGLDTDIVKLTLSDNRVYIEELTDSLNGTVSELIKIFKNKNADNEPAAPKFKPCSFKMNAIYIGLLTDLKTTNYVLEFNETAFSCASRAEALEETHANDNLREMSLVIQNVCILVLNPEVLPTLSKIFDIGFALKLIEDDIKKTLQIETPHSRVMLAPSTLIAVIFFIQEAKVSLQKVKQKGKFNSSSNAIEIPPYFETLSVNILSNKLCLGWIFEEDTDENGIVIGYESLFAAYEKPYGKLTIVDGYVATAQGKESNNFFFANGVPELNRSHLSSMQINFWFSGQFIEKDLFVRMNADKLDVRILTTSVEIVNVMRSSIESFQKKLAKISNIKKSSISTHNVAENLSDKVSILSIRSINCIAKYGGGIINLYTPDDIAQDSPKSSLELTSPSIEVSLDYMHNFPSQKQHWIRSLVNVESTHNILFSSCVPVLVNLTTEIQKQMERFNSEKKQLVHKTQEQTTNTQRISFDYKNLFKKIDTAIVINVGAQNITLTCEPRAKIQADLGFSNFRISMFTDSPDHSEPLSLSLQWSEIEISTRHIFSREISSSAGINEVYLDFMLTHENTIKTYGNTLISDMKFYVNMKQLQEITLFLDIWSPKTKKAQKLGSGPHSGQKCQPQALTEFTTPKIPWIYQIIFKNTSAVIDMDPSLGSINFKVPTFWISSHHRVDWSHSVSFYLDELNSKSDGRLGGLFEIKNIFFDSSISWPVKDNKFEAPLINLAFKMSHLSSKIGFDYHSFLIARVSDLQLAIRNERDESGLLKDLLIVSMSFGSVNIFLTALASANLYDIYATFARMRIENKKSYVQTLKESNPESSGKIHFSNNELLAPLRLRTNLTAEIGSFRLYVFPSTLFDSEVLVLKANKMNVEAATQTEQKTKTDLTWQIRDINISLAQFKNELTEEQFAELSVEEYNRQAALLEGDIILAAPSVFVGITTWQKIPDTDIEFLYSSSFGDKVDIKWNLDPINFIREMWATHVRALSVRRGHTEPSPSKPFFEDENIAEKIKIVNLGTKYKYIPLEEPHIEMPLLRDLGNATPPIEWFGVNRKRFPGMAHQLIVVPLQKLIYVAEDQYNRTLGDNLGTM